MKIISDLIDSLHHDAPIKQMMVGVHWTVVSSLFCGMASTVPSEKPHGEGAVMNAGLLDLTSAKSLSGYAQSENTLEACIGMACINSLIQIPDKNLVAENAFSVVAEQGINKNIAIFGHFPQIDYLHATARSVSVFELNPAKDELGLEKIPEVLPGAEVVAITSNTLINHTLDLILPYLMPGAFTVMVGPSTPLSPVLFEYGISMLAGVRVVNPEMVFHTISQGAIFKQVKGVDLVTIRK